MSIGTIGGADWLFMVTAKVFFRAGVADSRKRKPVSRIAEVPQGTAGRLSMASGRGDILKEAAW